MRLCASSFFCFVRRLDLTFINEMMIKFGDMNGSLGLNSTVLKMAEHWWAMMRKTKSYRFSVECWKFSQNINWKIYMAGLMCKDGDGGWLTGMVANCLEKTVFIHERLKRDKQIQILYTTQMVEREWSWVSNNNKKNFNNQ